MVGNKVIHDDLVSSSCLGRDETSKVPRLYITYKWEPNHDIVTSHIPARYSPTLSDTSILEAVARDLQVPAIRRVYFDGLENTRLTLKKSPWRPLSKHSQHVPLSCQPASFFIGFVQDRVSVSPPSDPD